MSAGATAVEVTSTRRPSAAIDAVAASRMSTTWAARSALARCGRPAVIEAAISATPRAQAMPGMGGPEVAERLSAVHPGLRIVFASGYTDDAKLRYAGAATTLPYLSRPFTADSLRARIRETLDRPASGHPRADEARRPGRAGDRRGPAGRGGRRAWSGARAPRATTARVERRAA